jgi:hypothetical protein
MNASHAPFGATCTGIPLMASVARPLPVVPKMKLESRTASALFAGGYATFSCSAPSTGGIGGNAAPAPGIVVAGTGGTVRGALAHADSNVAVARIPQARVRFSTQAPMLRVMLCIFPSRFVREPRRFFRADRLTRVARRHERTLTIPRCKKWQQQKSWYSCREGDQEIGRPAG